MQALITCCLSTQDHHVLLADVMRHCQVKKKVYDLSRQQACACHYKVLK